MKTRNFVGLVCVMLSATALAETVAVQSPNGKVAIQVSAVNGRLTLAATFEGKPVVESGELGVTVDGADLGQDVAIGPATRTSIRETYPTRGAHSQAVNECNQAAIAVTHTPTRTAYTLEVRACNDGVAYRYVVPGAGERLVTGERSGWKFPAGATVWYAKDFEASFEQAALDSLPAKTRIVCPVTLRLANGGPYVCLTEGNCVDYSGMKLEIAAANTLAAVFPCDKNGWKKTGPIETPWRLTIVAPDLTALVNTDMITNVCPPPTPELAKADWIVPGRAVWQWWSSGDPKLPDQTWWIDRTKELGFEYYLVDDGWKKWKEAGKDSWACLKDVVAYARSQNVRILIWVNYKDIKASAPRLAFLQKARDIGVAGIKADFFPGENRDTINWYEDCLAEAAKLHLLMNFHGTSKPTGRQRTWPHEMTREGIRGHEYHILRYKRINPPLHDTALPFTRFVAGHGDFTPTVFQPRELRGYSWMHELAQAVVYTSPIQHYADNPKYYLSNPSADIFKAIPAVWDETVVLPGSQIGQVAAFARRSGKTWFVGVLNGGTLGANGVTDFVLDTSFLGQGTFQADLLCDDLSRTDGLSRKARAVSGGEKITVPLREAGGMVGRFVPRP